MKATDNPLAAAHGIVNGFCISFLLWGLALISAAPMTSLY